MKNYKTISEITWKDGVKHLGGDPQRTPNVSIGEKIEDGGIIYKVTSIWFSGMVTLKSDEGDFQQVVPMYPAEIIMNNFEL